MEQTRLEQLLDAVGEAREVLILTHNDPDPDAIASAVALRYLLSAKLDVESDIIYRGIIGRAENKALVRYLARPLRQLRASDLRRSIPIALVDTQPGSGNNALPPHVAATIVLDHHPSQGPESPAQFADIRTDLGATSTLLTQYLQAAQLDPPTRLATALFYGIKTDTMGLIRSTSQQDVQAYLYLQPRVDLEAVVQMEHAQVSLDYFRRLHAALAGARVYGEVVVSFMGPMKRPDMAAEMADLLLRLQSTRWALCLGIYQDTVILAVRTRNRRGGAGRLARTIVGDRGTAGGHGMMAGAQIPLRGKDPNRTARRLVRSALEYLQVSPDTEGQRLI